MKKIFSHRIYFVLLLSICTVFTSCKKDETEEKQRESLENYITNTLKKPVDEKDGVYFVLLATDSSGQQRVFVKKNDVVEFEYQAWTYGGPVYATSNDSIAVRNQLVPLRLGGVEVGVGNLIPGLDRGLQRMALGDHALILFPFTLGYGEQYVGLVPPESALIFEVVVTKIN